MIQDNATGEKIFIPYIKDHMIYLPDDESLRRIFGAYSARKNLYLYGSDRQSILESINRGRHGVMPAFEGKLKPEELKAVSLYVYTRAGGHEVQR